MLQRRRSLNDQRGSLQGRLLQLQDRMFNSFDYPSSVPSRTQRRIFQDLQAAYRNNPPSEAPLVYRRQPTIKRNYYYQMKILPKMEKSFKIKVYPSFGRVNCPISRWIVSPSRLCLTVTGGLSPVSLIPSWLLWSPSWRFVSSQRESTTISVCVSLLPLWLALM